MNVSADDGVIVALAAAAVVVTEMQHVKTATGDFSNAEDTTAVVALLHILTAHTALALVLS